ncbi:MAG: hypothetical protein IKG00_03035 [Lachnospiraceae bacterium]|nr:hypothetical protein [Lachnospiraceae bacterium]
MDQNLGWWLLAAVECVFRYSSAASFDSKSLLSRKRVPPPSENRIVYIPPENFKTVASLIQRFD